MAFVVDEKKPDMLTPTERREQNGLDEEKLARHAIRFAKESLAGGLRTESASFQNRILRHLRTGELSPAGLDPLIKRLSGRVAEEPLIAHTMEDRKEIADQLSNVATGILRVFRYTKSREAQMREDETTERNVSFYTNDHLDAGHEIDLVEIVEEDSSVSEIRLVQVGSALKHKPHEAARAHEAYLESLRPPPDYPTFELPTERKGPLNDLFEKMRKEGVTGDDLKELRTHLGEIVTGLFDDNRMEPNQSPTETLRHIQSWIRSTALNVTPEGMEERLAELKFLFDDDPSGGLLEKVAKDLANSNDPEKAATELQRLKDDHALLRAWAKVHGQRNAADDPSNIFADKNITWTSVTVVNGREEAVPLHLAHV